MPQFDTGFYYSQIFWLVIIFASLYMIVYKLIIPIIEKNLHNRQTLIDSNIKEAENLSSRAKILQKQYTSEIEKIKSSIEKLLKETTDTMEKTFASQKMKLNTELKKQLEENFCHIEEYNKQFWYNEKQTCINLAKLLIEKFTNKPANLLLLEESYKKI